MYAEPISETPAVHNLEHVYVIVHYRPTSDGAPSSDSVGALETHVSGEARVLMAPYPILPDGAGLVLVASDTRWECPASLTPEQAVQSTSGFVDAYRGTTVAPKARMGLLEPLLGP